MQYCVNYSTSHYIMALARRGSWPPVTSPATNSRRSLRLMRGLVLQGPRYNNENLNHNTSNHSNDSTRRSLRLMRGLVLLAGTTCLTLLIQYALICFMRCLLNLCCQGSPQFANIFSTFEDNLRYTSNVRQVVPPGPGHLGAKVRGVPMRAAGGGRRRGRVAGLGAGQGLSYHIIS